MKKDFARPQNGCSRLQRSQAVQGNRVHRRASRARTNPAGVANWTMSSSGQLSAHVTSAVG